VSTRSPSRTRVLGDSWPISGRRGSGLDATEEVALVAHSARGRLLSVHRAWLRWEDLEDCYSQATVELVAQARRGELRCTSRASLRGMLELRFVSRVRDRRRALRGRSPDQAMLDGALSLGGAGRPEVEIADPRADVERRTMLRLDLRSLELAARGLSSDQRLVLACQVGLQMSAGEFCATFGWSAEKHRKVAQRARARLRRLLAEPPAAAAAAAPASHSVADGADPGRAGENFFEDECPALREGSVKRAGTHL
jgi:DNA-directed RNA polymerase specialized sigma24 family protein